MVMVCQYCGSSNLVKDGTFYRKREKTVNQKYKCKSCGRFTKEFSEYRMKHTQDVVNAAIKLNETLSLRDTAAELFKRFGIKVTYMTVRNWILKDLERRQQHFKLEFVDIPCFKCFSLHEYEARKCNPVDCETLTEYLKL